MSQHAPDFSDDFRREFDQLLRWRRDVRRFRTDPVEPEVYERCLASFGLAPSVGLSEPWRLIRVQSAKARHAALSNFENANAKALGGYSGDQAALYATLKLSGMSDAPEQLAIFCDEETPKGAGLGAATMPEMRRYSVVAAIFQFWLAARTEGLGVGWVSVLDPDTLSQDLAVPDSWRLVAYLCVGYPEEERATPELIDAGWEDRHASLPIESR